MNAHHTLNTLEISLNGQDSFRPRTRTAETQDKIHVRRQINAVNIRNGCAGCSEIISPEIRKQVGIERMPFIFKLLDIYLVDSTFASEYHILFSFMLKFYIYDQLSPHYLVLCSLTLSMAQVLDKYYVAWREEAFD